MEECEAGSALIGEGNAGMNNAWTEEVVPDRTLGHAIMAVVCIPLASHISTRRSSDILTIVVKSFIYRRIFLLSATEEMVTEFRDQ